MKEPYHQEGINPSIGTYKSSLNDNILGWGLLIEITHPK
jgi:hypothetical protein